MKRIFAVMMILAMLFLCVGCGTPAPEGESSATEPRSQTEPSSALPAGPGLVGTEPEPTASFPKSTGPSEITTMVDLSTSVAPSSSAAPVVTTKPPIPPTKAAVVEYYNKVANESKAQKNFSVKKIEKLDCHLTGGSLPGPILNLVDGQLDMLRKNANVQETFKNGKGTQNAGRTPQGFLPPGDQPYMSKLKPEWAKSAACADKGSYWEIKIVLLEETVLAKSEPPVKTDSCMDTLDVDWNDLGFSVSDDTTSTVHDATITAKINPVTGRILELHIYEPVKVQGKISIIKVIVEGYWKQDIWFTW
ncbi:MAG: hypothetical protein LBJ11_09210 [Oscillospiraceae bacterium]|nr:hypothetical protein [Oscillospiraceae bacterium]